MTEAKVVNEYVLEVKIRSRYQINLMSILEEIGPRLCNNIGVEEVAIRVPNAIPIWTMKTVTMKETKNE